MSAGLNATPLIGIDAVAIDIEATGLDPRKARMVEVAVVPIHAGRPGGVSFRTLVNPGEPIPAAATAVHRIADADVSGAPGFADIWPSLSERIAGRVVVGHSVGYDLALLERECERAGFRWRPIRAIDTQMLAQVAQPALPDYSLERLCAWLGIAIEGRHSAAGDATAAARVLCALVPLLRERGIRTLGEATRACRTALEAPGAAPPAAWSTAAVTGEIEAPRAGRVDSFPYRNRIGDVMSAPPHFAPPDMTLGEALRVMVRDKVSSVFVTTAEGAPLPADTGIVTERDAMRALDRHGPDALAMPLSEAMTRPLAAVAADAFAHVAIGRMNRLRIRHLGVTDASGRVIGALSARDLLRLRAEEAVELGDEIAEARDVHELAAAWAKLQRVAASLTGEGLDAREVASLISSGVVELSRRAAILAEGKLASEGRGAPPCGYAYVVLGSAGRGESLLAMDQDNALIFDDGAPPDADRWFEALGRAASDILHEAGVPYCKGGVMASNPQWRGPVSDWRRRVEGWIARSDPQDLLSVDIFFDLLGAHGDAAMADGLWRHAFDAARGNAVFAKLLIESAGEPASSRGWFGGFRTEGGRLDLKRAGLFGVVSTARALAICHHVVERSTPARLAGLAAHAGALGGDLGALADAQALFLELILRQQIADIGTGLPPTNAVEVARLSRGEHERLGRALEAVEQAAELARSLLFRG